MENFCPLVEAEQEAARIAATNPMRVSPTEVAPGKKYSPLDNESGRRAWSVNWQGRVALTRLLQPGTGLNGHATRSLLCASQPLPFRKNYLQYVNTCCHAANRVHIPAARTIMRPVEILFAFGVVPAANIRDHCHTRIASCRAKLGGQADRASLERRSRPGRNARSINSGAMTCACSPESYHRNRLGLTIPRAFE
jgi:hypothetical protein